MYGGGAIRLLPLPTWKRASFAIVAALAAASVVVAVLSLVHGETGAVESAAAASPLAHAGAQPLYRIVGCRSNGLVAHRFGPPKHEVAIGFDDGPAADTPAFVRMLEVNHAHATFFMIGRQVDATFRETMLRELRDGDSLGDHTWSHPNLTLKGIDVRAQLLSTLAVIREQTGYTPCLFRPPYGAWNKAVLRTARSLGLSTVLWDDDPSDYTQPGTQVIVHTVLSEVGPGAIIISHDGGGPRGQTLAAYPQIIAGLRRRGYGIVTIEQLLGYRPVYERCVKLCDGLGLPRRELPRDAILRPAQ